MNGDANSASASDMWCLWREGGTAAGEAQPWAVAAAVYKLLKVTQCWWSVGSSVSRLMPAALSLPWAVPSRPSAAVPGAWPAPTEPNKSTLVTMVAVTTADATPAPAVTKAFLWALKASSYLLFLFHFSLAGAHLFCFSIVSHRLKENL